MITVYLFMTEFCNELCEYVQNTSNFRFASKQHYTKELARYWLISGGYVYAVCNTYILSY